MVDFETLHESNVQYAVRTPETGRTKQFGNVTVVFINRETGKHLKENLKGNSPVNAEIHKARTNGHQPAVPGVQVDINASIHFGEDERFSVCFL